MSQILIIQAHPNTETSFSSALAASYAKGAAAHARVKTINLNELSFDPVLHDGYSTIQPLEPDLLFAKQCIEEARHVVWVFPMWWVGAPALLKGFIDRLFLPGWAFSYDEGSAIPAKLLKGRTARVIVTMDSPRWWYVLNYRRALRASFEVGVLKFCGFSPVQRTMLYGLHNSDERARAKMLERAFNDGVRDGKALKPLERNLLVSEPAS